VQLGETHVLHGPRHCANVAGMGCIHQNDANGHAKELNALREECCILVLLRQNAAGRIAASPH
jgi:hypothetical protein